MFRAHLESAGRLGPRFRLVIVEKSISNQQGLQCMYNVADV